MDTCGDVPGYKTPANIPDGVADLSPTRIVTYGDVPGYKTPANIPDGVAGAGPRACERGTVPAPQRVWAVVNGGNETANQT